MRSESCRYRINAVRCKILGDKSPAISTTSPAELRIAPCDLIPATFAAIYNLAGNPCQPCRQPNGSDHLIASLFVNSSPYEFITKTF